MSRQSLHVRHLPGAWTLRLPVGKRVLETRLEKTRISQHQNYFLGGRGAVLCFFFKFKHEDDIQSKPLA